MEPSTDLVMQALGDEEGYKLASALIKGGPQAQSVLAESAAVSAQRTATQLHLMRALGLVERERSTRGKWSITDPASVARLFAYAAELAASLAAERSKSAAGDRKEWEAQAKSHSRTKAKES
jgi:hypothetical protein